MNRHVNLMTDSAKFRTAARLHLRWWGVSLAGLMVMLTPLTLMRWEEATKARKAHEAMESSYEPIRRLVKINRELRDEAVGLVKNDRLELELSWNRPVAVLLGVVSAAAAESSGQLYVEHLEIKDRPPGGGAPPTSAANPSAEQRLHIEAAATTAYDIVTFVEALRKAPIKSVKVTSDAIISVDGKDHKKYTLECTF
jgi:hypothetical protein